MIVISDSNVIFSALISPNGVNAQIFNSKNRIQFIAPVYLIDEINNHFDEIVDYSGRPKREIKNELNAILSRIKMVALDDIPDKYLIDASKIVYDIDKDDTFFVALNRYKKHKIWTGDRSLINGLKKKGYDICITTAELKKYLYKKK
jgi:predicted nucleic acid-binding protein